MEQPARVIRTEHTCCTNQAELKGLADAGFDEYEFMPAGESNGACDTCDDLDGERFKIADAVVGVNLPPMHPNCRCTIGAVMESDEDVQVEIDRLLDGRSIEDIERELDAKIEQENPQKLLTNSNESDIIKADKDEAAETNMTVQKDEALTIEAMTDKVMSVTDFVIADAKIEGFCLNPNGKHWDHFRDVGYTVKDGNILRSQLKDAFNNGLRVDIKEGKVKGDICFNIYTKLGITEQHLFLTGWQIDHDTNYARFITAFDKEGRH